MTKVRGKAMGLKYPKEWKYDGFPHEISIEAHRKFLKLIDLMAEGVERPKAIYEDFKSAFGNTSNSSDASWAESDMHRAMDGGRENAARYVVAFYAGMESVEERGIAVPTVKRLNRILAEHEIPLVIDPPNLNRREGDILLVKENDPEESLALGFIQGERIGYGGFGTVYKVTRKTQLGEYHYAMKIFDPSPNNPRKERAGQRFLRELRTLERLQHRAIIPLLEAGLNAEQVPYFLMPLVKGQDLREALEGAESEKVYRVFDEILNALEFAHSRKVLHRDLKPKNILVRNVDEQPLILDFGASFFLDDGEEDLTTTLIGTEPYIPEEVRRNPKHRTVQQDVYACGIMLYEVIARSLPHLNDYESVEDQVKGFDGVDQVIKKAIAAERNRYSTITDLREALRKLSQ